MTSGWSSQDRTRRSVLAGLGLGSALVLAACTVGSAADDGSDEGGSSGSNEPKVPAALLSSSIADGTQDVPPSTPLHVTASGGTLDTVTVTTAAGTAVEGAIDTATSTWAPSAPLDYDTTYSIAATASNSAGDTTDLAATFTTVTPGALIFPSIGPLDGTVVGIAMPVRIYFDQAVTDRKTVQQNLAVTPTPAQNGGWNWISDTEVHWRPEQYWQAGTKVQVDANLHGVNAGNGAWGKVNRTINFDVGKDQRSTCNTNEHQMYCYESGQVVKTIPVSAGKEEPGRYTHSGVHVVIDKKEKMTMDSTTYGLALDAGGYQTEVDWATRISNNGEFVHSAPWSLAQQGVSNTSHGCLNASPENAKWFLQWSQIGDPVEISGTPVKLTIDDGDIFDWTIDWATWQQGSAL